MTILYILIGLSLFSTTSTVAYGMLNNWYPIKNSIMRTFYVIGICLSSILLMGFAASIYGKKFKDNNPVEYEKIQQEVYIKKYK